MKKLVLAFLIFTITFISCKTNKSTSSTTIKETKVVVVEEQTKEKTNIETKDSSTIETLSKDNLITKGKNLFYKKTCATCHAAETKIVGPSIKDIAAKYAETNGNLIKFLKGNADAIVNTDPTQVKIMKDNINGIVKDIKPDELQAIVAYMRSVK